MDNININNNSDIGITCRCGSIFSGIAIYYKEIVKLYLAHMEAHNE